MNKVKCYPACFICDDKLKTKTKDAKMHMYVSVKEEVCWTLVFSVCFYCSYVKSNRYIQLITWKKGLAIITMKLKMLSLSASILITTSICPSQLTINNISLEGMTLSRCRTPVLFHREICLHASSFHFQIHSFIWN